MVTQPVFAWLLTSSNFQLIFSLTSIHPQACSQVINYFLPKHANLFDKKPIYGSHRKWKYPITCFWNPVAQKWLIVFEKTVRKISWKRFHLLWLQKKSDSVQTQSHSNTSSLNSLQIQKSIEFLQLLKSSSNFEKERSMKEFQTKSEDIKLNHYSQPHKSTPLGRCLSKLMPPS